MALKKREPEAGNDNAAATENKEPVTATGPAVTGATTAYVVPVQDAEAIDQPAPVEVEKTTTAVAVAKPAGALSTARKVDMSNLLFHDKVDLLRAEFGTMPRLKPTQGGFSDGDAKKHGAWLEVQLLSYSTYFVIGPNDKDAPKETVKYSADGKMCDDGSDSVAGWLAHIQQDWPKANVKEYIELVAILNASEKPQGHEGEMVQIQLSPTSRTGFIGYVQQESFKVAVGKADLEGADLLRVEALGVNANGNDWTKATFKRGGGQ